MKTRDQRVVHYAVRWDSLSAQADILWGGPVDYSRSLEMAFDYLDCADFAKESAARDSTLARLDWMLRASACTLRARHWANKAFNDLHAEAGSIVYVVIQSGPAQTLAALTLLMGMSLRLPWTPWKVGRIRWCLERANTLAPDEASVPRHVLGLLECARAYIAWVDRPSEFRLFLDSEASDEAYAHRGRAESLFGRLIAELGGTLDKPPEATESSKVALARCMALIGELVANLREQFGDKAGYWRSTAEHLKQLARA